MAPAHPLLSEPTAAPPPGTGRPAAAPFLTADWRQVVFVHFAIRPAELAPLVPHPLELVDGRAFISLVSFNLERLRPAGLLPSRVGRALLGPISRHAFLNLRTYVRGPAGPGVHFLTEWINNPISLRLGPLIYGLPYRFASIQRADLTAGGLTQIRATESGGGEAVGITVPLCPRETAPCAEGSLDAFLLERYTAYTRRQSIDRCFHVAHEPWSVAPVDLVRTDTSLIERMYPWFARAELIAAHVGPGVRGVSIGRPHRCADRAEAREAAEVAVLAGGAGR